MTSSLRHAVRSLLAAPSFTAIAICTLALGVGVNSAMYSLINELLFTSTAFPEPKRVTQVFGSTPQQELLGFSATEFRELKEHATSFKALTLIRGEMENISIDNRPPEQIQGTATDENLFAVTGIQPLLGRAYTAQECGATQSTVVLITESYWKRSFGADPNVLGKSIQLTGKPHTIIGVVPDKLITTFIFGEAEFLKPVTYHADMLKNRDYRIFGILGRLQDGVSRQSAAAQLGPLAERWKQDTPRYYENYHFRVEIAGRLVDKGNTTILLLLLVLGFAILVIACTNLANLQLARATARMKELAIRSALGANRAALIRYQMIEALVLSFAGAALGLLLAVWLNDLLGSNIRIGLKSTLAIRLDSSVLLFTGACAIFTAIAFGLIPAWLASRADINEALKNQARGSTGGKASRRIRAGLVVAQVAMAFTLLTVALFMVVSVTMEINTPPNWDADKVLTANTQIDEGVYNTAEAKQVIYDALRRRLSSIPGVESVTLASGLPTAVGGNQTKTVLSDAMDVTSRDLPTTASYLVVPTHFQTLGIQFLEGTNFSESTKEKDPQKVIVSETLARALWPEQSALGKRIGERNEKGEVEWREVIGVVKDADIAGGVFNGNIKTKGQLYLNMVHTPWGFMNIALRSDRPSALANDLRRAVADVNPLMPVRLVWTFEDIKNLTLHNIFIVNGLLCGFAALGLVLASIGLYGVVSDNVQQRLNEFGIRLALGAQPADILKLVLRAGMILTVIGLVLGGGITYLILAQLGTQFPPAAGYSQIPWTLATLTTITAVAFLSTWFPARAATHADPMQALRAD
ncbi:ADOP family duplicated permease [Nibricoccus sp. IMCC34717]|uniref:ADOP family duplicated permease n=1 Tax=Nibricoccus sp. IMCC34717 TaxID=3034021 RepID=UPI00384B29BB